MTGSIPAAWPPQTTRLRVGALTLDLRYRRVAHADGESELTQRCFDLAQLFLAEPGVLHTREDIFRRVWPGVVVEDANLTTSIWMLRKALGDESRHWLRTIAKRGYVFDPPVPVEVVVDISPIELSAPVETAAPRAPLRRRARWFAAAALACCAVAAAQWHARAPAPLRVLLVAAGAGGDSASRWPERLLVAWIDWKLRLAPSLRVLAPGDAGADDGARETAVLLSVDMPADTAESWHIRARFRGEATAPDIVVASTPERLIADLDATSERVRAVLAPSDAGTVWPSLALDAAIAAQFVDAVDARARHRWGAAALGFGAVAQRAPGFGLARVLHAEALAELGQQSAALDAWRGAQAWLAALPGDATAPLAALGLAIAQRYDDAAAAYAALARERPVDASAFRYAAARSLRRAGRSDEALALLRGPAPSEPSLALVWRLERAIAELMTGAPHDVHASVADIERLGARLGFAHERARAALIDAEAHAIAGDAPDAALFETAAQRFASVDDRLGALRARYLAATFGVGGDIGRRLDELLAEARAAGNAAAEIDALRRMAFFHYRAGDMAAYRVRLAQAFDVAAAAGDRTARQTLALDLAHQDLLRGAYAALDGRLAQLRGESVQGMTATWLGQFEAGMQFRRGQYAQSVATVDRAEAAFGDAPAPAMAAGLACARGAVALARGESARARQAFASCGSRRLPHYELLAGIGEAELALQGGDPDAARRGLAGIEARLRTLASTPDRWMLALELAPVFARGGDTVSARRLVLPLLPTLERAGYAQLEADARTTLAESALADGDRDVARRELARAEALAGADDWYGRRRLRTVAALLAPTAPETAQALSALDADARERGDVLGELLAHSLLDRYGATACDTQRHSLLIAQSGMRGASDAWMLRPESGSPLAIK